MQRELTGWPAPDRPLLAGVSSFGMGGTNAHVVLAESPVPAPERDRAPAGPAVIPWVVSGRTADALRAQAERLVEAVAADDTLDPADIGLSLAAHRTLFGHRAVVLGESRAALLEGLASVARAASSPGVVIGGAPTGAESPGGPALLFTGQGAQRVGMGLELRRSFPVFADALDEVCAHLDPLLDRPLSELIASGDGLDETHLTQRRSSRSRWRCTASSPRGAWCPSTSRATPSARSPRRTPPGCSRWRTPPRWWPRGAG
ncbi:ketoacyl-synthetase C-terminal extension domain-containing protein [Streptomyces indonesiensis]